MAKESKTERESLWLSAEVGGQSSVSASDEGATKCGFLGQKLDPGIPVYNEVKVQYLCI